MSIDKLSLSLASLKPIGSAAAPERPQGAGGAGPNSFSDFLSNAFEEVSNLQTEADSKIEQLVTKRHTISTHEAMIALEKADIAFQLMNQVRTKIVRAYEEIMRTQI